MFSYTAKSVNAISFLLTTILYFVFQYGFPYLSTSHSILTDAPENNSLTNAEISAPIKQNSQKTNSIPSKTTNTTKKANTVKSTNIPKGKQASMVEKVWKLQIPSISLDASVASGTSEEIMNKYIGHFENTSTWEGNVGLAAHNRGYPVNYFNRLKELEVGDSIYYTTQYGTKEYTVIVSTIIEDTDWSYLEPTKDNRITLITCVENVPEKRRCVQAVEVN